MSITKEELFLILRAGRKEGALEKEEEEMICRVLGLKNIYVSMIMTERVNIEAISLSKSSKKDEFLELVMEIGKSRIPVYGRNLDDIKGIIYVKDLLVTIKENVPFQVENFLQPPLFISPDERISRVFKEFNRRKTHIALIKKEGILKGIITMEDILEETVGEILDEYDLSRIKKR